MTAIVKVNPVPVRALVASEEREPSFGELVTMGNQLVATGFLPAHIKNGACAAAIIMTGRELGMPPMIALRSLHMVKGKVVEDAASQLARFKATGGHAHFVELSEAKAELELVHPNGDKHLEVFTLADAKRAGLTGENWQKYPRAMLRSRVITAALKSIGWDGGVGAYDPDEVLAFTDSSSTRVEATRVVDDEATQLYNTKAACVGELVRLGVTNEKEQREKVRGINGGTMPDDDIEEWQEVLGVLTATSTPEEKEIRPD